MFSSYLIHENEKSDKSGKILEDRIKTAGHKMMKKIIKDEPKDIEYSLLNSIRFEM